MSWARRIFNLRTLIVALGILVVAGSIVVWRYYTRAATVQAVQRELDLVRQAGEPLTPEEFTAFQALPSGERNLAFLWTIAVGNFNLANFEKPAAGLPVVGKGDFTRLRPDQEASQLAEAERFLEDYAQTLQAIDAAAKEVGGCRYPIKFDKEYGPLMPHATNMSAAGRLLALRGRVAAYRGDQAEAMERVRQILVLAHTLDEAATFAEQMVRSTLNRRALQEIEFLLNEFAWSEEQLIEFDRLVDGIDYEEPAIRSLLGQRAVAHFMFENPRSVQGLSSKLQDLKLQSWQIGPVDREFAFSEFRKVIAAARQSLWAGRVAADDAAQRLKAFSREEQYVRIMSLFVIPDIALSLDVAVSTEAQRRIVAAEIAATRFRLQHGRMPTELAKLVPDYLPEEPRDPFGEEPLHWRFAEDSLTVWSVGRNLTDDGGEGDFTRREPDLVGRLRVPRVVPAL